MHKNLSKKAQRQFADFNSEWRPDWKDASQYPNPKTTSRAQWAWEFLRRNPEYQRDYLERVILGEKKPVNPEDGPKNYIYFKKKYGLILLNIHAEIPNPALDKLKYACFQKQGIEITIKPESETKPYYEAFTALYNGHALVLFDLSFSLEAQFKVAEKKLKEIQRGYKKKKLVPEKYIRVHPDIYLKYLRVLDGRFYEAKRRELATTLYESPYKIRAVDEAYKKAKILSEQHYRLIAFGTE
jgi:hypothetical protein